MILTICWGGEGAKKRLNGLSQRRWSAWRCPGAIIKSFILSSIHSFSKSLLSSHAVPRVYNSEQDNTVPAKVTICPRLPDTVLVFALEIHGFLAKVGACILPAWVLVPALLLTSYLFSIRTFYWALVFSFINGKNNIYLQEKFED